MTDEPKPEAPALPALVDRATWTAEREALLIREKAHTHEGDAIAAARRRLPAVEVDAARGGGVEVIAPTWGLLDRTLYGRQETWEDSPPGWPQPWAVEPESFRTDGRPTAQLSRLAAGRSDELGPPRAARPRPAASSRVGGE